MGNAEVDEMRTLVLCRSGVTASGKAIAGVEWARTAGHGYTSVEVLGNDYDSHVALIHRGKVTLFGHLGGYATSRPVAFDDGSFLYMVSVKRGMEISLHTAAGRTEHLGTTGTFYGGVQYTPSGRELVALSEVGVPGAYTASKLLVASGTSRTRVIRIPFAAVNLLVPDDQHALVAGASDDPNGRTFDVNLSSGIATPLPIGYYPIAEDAQREQVLMKSYDGSLAWMSMATRALTPISTDGITGGWRVVGGDLQRVG